MITQSFLSADFTKRDIHERSGLVCGNMQQSAAGSLQTKQGALVASNPKFPSLNSVQRPSEQPSRSAVRYGRWLIPRGAHIRTRQRRQITRRFSWYSSVPPGKLRDRPPIKQRTLSFHIPINKQLNKNINSEFLLSLNRVLKNGRFHLSLSSNVYGEQSSNKKVPYSSVSQPLWDRGPVNSFFHKTTARSQQIYSSVLFQFFKVHTLN